MTPRSLVWSCNEWDPLEEVIVGNPLNARYPTPDPSTRLAEFPDRRLEDIPQGPFPQRIIQETEEDLDAFVAVLTKLGITVRRPETWPHEARFSTIHWESQGYYNYCPRDILLVIGDQIIETPNVIRSRALETFSYRSLMVDYLKSGARWYSAPRPMLLDSLFDVDLTRPKRGKGAKAVESFPGRFAAWSEILFLTGVVAGLVGAARATGRALAPAGLSVTRHWRPRRRILAVCQCNLRNLYKILTFNL